LDIKRLETKFAHGYCLGTNVFYISLYNDHGEEQVMTNEDLQQWSQLWIEENNAFEAKA
jgi:hypothetical protein